LLTELSCWYFVLWNDVLSLLFCEVVNSWTKQTKLMLFLDVLEILLHLILYPPVLRSLCYLVLNHDLLVMIVILYFAKSLDCLYLLVLVVKFAVNRLLSGLMCDPLVLLQKHYLIYDFSGFYYSNWVLEPSRI